MGLAAIAVASLLGGLWVLRPLAGARSWAGRTLCGPVGSGSTGDGVEESGVSDPGAVQGLRLSIVRVGVFGRFTGTLSGGRFGAGQPVRGWLRARGFTAAYEAGASVRGALQGRYRGGALEGRCREIMLADRSGDRRLLVTTFSFRLEPCRD